MVNIGTAGALHDHHSGLFLPSRVLEHDLDAAVLADLGYTTESSWEIPGGDGTVLARVAAEFGVPLRLVKVVSDSADEAAVDWPQRVDAAAQLIGEWLRESGD